MLVVVSIVFASYVVIQGDDSVSGETGNSDKDVIVYDANQLKDAIEKQYGKIILGTDIMIPKEWTNESDRMYITSDLFLDLNGKTITLPEELGALSCYNFSLFFIKEAKLTVDGNGMITVIGNGPYLFYLFKNSDLIINNGTFHAGVTIAQLGNSKSVPEDHTSSSVIVNGGHYSIAPYINSNKLPVYDFMFNFKDEWRDAGDIIIRGGSFENFNPSDNASEGKNTNYVPGGYTVSSIKDDIMIYHVSKDVISDADVVVENDETSIKIDSSIPSIDVVFENNDYKKISLNVEGSYVIDLSLKEQVTGSIPGFSEVFEIGITFKDLNGESVSPSYKAEITIPVQNKIGYVTKVWYIGVNENIEMPVVSQSLSSITFETTHNSTYAITYEIVEGNMPDYDDDELPFIPPQSGDDGGADTTTYVAVAAAAAVVAILAVLAVGISKGKL